ncbi:hypothetical protein E5288_WYG014768 [Bos mutus]|uniref:NTF2 domain-containing protein n=2 Tax=Bos mutus TaxID=72004 RepID=A0A6B0SEQ2_9CETA|nr:hypothetical protein [Bos mutus]
MALRGVQSVRAAVGSLCAILAPSVPCSPRPWGPRAGAVRALSTGPAVLSVRKFTGKHEWEFKTYVDQACRAAEEFVNIYYETMDKRRRALTRLYLDKATLIWNGNVVTGLEALANFFDMLPSSEFQVNMLDCQPVHEQATQSQTTVLVVTSGTVKFDGNKQHYFNQNFLLTAQTTANNTVWKIASDCFRFQDWATI